MFQAHRYPCSISEFVELSSGSAVALCDSVSKEKEPYGV